MVEVVYILTTLHLPQCLYRAVNFYVFSVYDNIIHLKLLLLFFIIRMTMFLLCGRLPACRKSGSCLVVLFWQLYSLPNSKLWQCFTLVCLLAINQQKKTRFSLICNNISFIFTRLFKCYINKYFFSLLNMFPFYITRVIVKKKPCTLAL